MNKKIFNILVVCLIVFIAIYFGLKISNYGEKLNDADNTFKSGRLVYNLLFKSMF